MHNYPRKIPGRQLETIFEDSSSTKSDICHSARKMNKDTMTADERHMSEKSLDPKQYSDLCVKGLGTLVLQRSTAPSRPTSAYHLPVSHNASCKEGHREADQIQPLKPRASTDTTMATDVNSRTKLTAEC